MFDRLRPDVFPVSDEFVYRPLAEVECLAG